MRAKQLLQHVRSRIQNLTRELDTTKKQRDGLIARLDQVEIGKGLFIVHLYIYSYNICNLKLA